MESGSRPGGAEEVDGCGMGLSGERWGLLALLDVPRWWWWWWW
jgi:hypothetical protein